MNSLQRVMYVEDEADIRTIAKLALETIGGLTVLTCESGEQALREVDAFAPDIILLDVMMPGMDGPRLLAELRTRPTLSSVPVAFMTAKVQPAEIEHFKSLGARDVIAKPFDPMTLADQVRSIWEAARDE